MKLKILVALFLLSVGHVLKTQAETLYYTHEGLHLKFAIDTETKEAMLGNGIDSEKNAIARPPLTDPWWNESPQTNYWKDIDVPSTIICEGTAYTRDGGNKNISRETYTVTSVAPNAFYKATELQTIKLPETIKEIGSYAFYYCINLKSINIPDQVTAIYAGTFVWCNKLTSIHLPDNITFIGQSAFSDCISLEEINIPGKCTRIAEEAFKWCTSLSTLTIEDGTTPLQLAYCYGLGLNYEGSMPKYYRGMFSDCPLKRLYLGRDIEFYSDYINGWYPPFMGYYYKGKGTNNKDIFIKEGKNYQEVTIGDNVTTIPESMFQYASIPNAITLPSNLVSIGDEAFSHNSGTGGVLHQSQIVFPATLQSIGKNAFTNCVGLGTIVCEGTTPPTLPDELYYHAFWNCNPLFFVPSGCRSVYLSDENWSKHKIVEMSDEVVTINVKTPGSLLDRLLAQGYQLGNITRLKLKGTLNDDDWANVKKMNVLYDLDISELNLEEISESQFEKSSLIYIKLPQTIKAIRNNAFSQSRSLSGTIEIPASCTEIGNQAFRETGISGISFNGSVHIGQWVFTECSNLIDVNVTGDQTIVDQYGFANCGIKKITIGKGVQFGEDAAALCDNLKEVILEDGVKSIGNWAFHNLQGLEKLTFEGSVGMVESGAFSNLEDLSEIHITDIEKWCQITFMDYNGTPGNPLYTPNSDYKARHLYYNGEEIENIEFSDDLVFIGDYSFYNCDKLKTVKLPQTLRSIGTRAFSGCRALEEIIFPSGLESIGSYAFCLCQSLSVIDIPNTVTSIFSNAFYNNKLEKIVVHWKDPINISSNVFYGVPNNCYLYIPIGTSSKYSNAGWSCIPNIKARGILHVKVNDGGSVNSLDHVVSNKSEDLFFTPYNSFVIELMPNEGFRILKVKLDGVDVLSSLSNNQIEIEEPEEDHSLIVVFANEGVNIGDANGDLTVDYADVTAITNYLLKKSPMSFYDYAADLNDDGVVNITDVLLLISKIKYNQ